MFRHLPHRSMVIPFNLLRGKGRSRQLGTCADPAQPDREGLGLITEKCTLTVCSERRRSRQAWGVPDNPDLLTAGREIRRHRLLRNLSQEQLAERAGLHRNYIGFLERGERNASLTTLFAVARALEVPLSELFAGIEFKDIPAVGALFAARDE